MSADGDIVREALIPGTSLTVGDQVLAALARLEAAEEAMHAQADLRYRAEAQRDTLAEALRSIDVGFALTAAEMRDRARAALAEAGLE